MPKNNPEHINQQIIIRFSMLEYSIKLKMAFINNLWRSINNLTYKWYEIILIELMD